MTNEEKLEKAILILKKIEWVECGPADRFCPKCQCYEPNGHGWGCDLEELLEPEEESDDKK